MDEPFNVERALRYLVFALQENNRQLEDKIEALQKALDKLSERVDKLDFMDSESESLMQQYIEKRIAEVEPKSLKEARRLSPGSMTVKEAAEELGVTVKSIYNYIEKGILQTEKIGRRRMVLRESVDALK